MFLILGEGVISLLDSDSEEDTPRSQPPINADQPCPLQPVSDTDSGEESSSYPYFLQEYCA